MRENQKKELTREDLDEWVKDKNKEFLIRILTDKLKKADYRVLIEVGKLLGL